MFKKGYKQTEEHKRKIGLANSIALKGRKVNKNQLNALKKGRQNYTKERTRKMVNTRREKNNYNHSEKNIEQIKKGIKKTFPDGRPINSGNWKKNHTPWNKGLIGYITGVLNPNWKGGKSFESYPSTFNDKLKMKIKKRDKYTCQLCTIKIIEKRRIKTNPSINWLVTHHIDYNKKNCLPNNLITLCNFCNIFVNTKRNQWSKFFQNKLK